MPLLRRKNTFQAPLGFGNSEGEVNRMADMSKETEQKIAQLQVMEQNLQGLMQQRQTFQAQLMEVENALSEVTGAKAPLYKIVGNVMISAEKESLKKDLTSRKEILDLRLKSLQKQEDALKEKAESLQGEVVKELKH